MKNKRERIIYYIHFLLLIALLVSCLSLLCIPASAEYKGTCGEKLTWKLNAGTLTISGSGAMTNFEEPEMAPWYEYREQILRVVFPEKITSVGNLAFYGCKNLISVVFPDSVNTIGHYAFAECDSLCILNFGNSIKEIGRGSFYKCINLINLFFPYSLEKIESQAFYGCESLNYISIPQHVSQIEDAAFAYCTSLIAAEIKCNITSVSNWLFMGCNNLSHVAFSKSVTSIENYAFMDCENLSYIYYDGDNKADISDKIATDVPDFKDIVQFVSGEIPNKIQNSDLHHGEEEYASVTTIITKQNDVSVSTIVEIISNKKEPASTLAPEATPGVGESLEFDNHSYDIQINVAVNNDDDWQDVTNMVLESLDYIDEVYSDISDFTKTNINLHINSGRIDENFISDMTGRDVSVNVISQSGSSWKVDCSEIGKNTVIKNTNYSYRVTEGSKEISQKLNTDKCYKLIFDDNAYVNAQVVVKLPSNNTANSNAFLYQVEKDGSYTRLQAVKVGTSGEVNLYLGAVNNKTQYVIGINVPNEQIDDIIIPDEILQQNSGAIARLEKIEYVITGIDSSWGISFKKVTIILIAVLVGCAVLVGVIMGIMNKRKLKKYKITIK